VKSSSTCWRNTTSCSSRTSPSFYTGYGAEHTVDIHHIFRDFDADENDPASYDFERTDIYLQDIESVGTKCFYRLGSRIEHGKKEGTFPPKDNQKWAEICEHIIRHYNEGWANGFHMGIEYWEIWNEPDCRNPDGSNPCWQGTDEQFIDLFTITLRHLKTCFPNLKIGGPALCSTWNERWNEMIFTALKEQNLPLDFFSFHGYAKMPEAYAESAFHARELLDACGYTDTEIILNEWNYIKGWTGDNWKYSLRMEKGLKGSSFTTASMICAQNSPMDHFMYYDARPCGMCGLFDTDTMALLKGYYPFPMFGALYKLGPQAESVSDEGLYSLAAISEDKAAVLLTHYYDEDERHEETVKISLKGLSEGVWSASFFLLDAGHDNELVREELLANGGADVYVKLPLFATYLVKLTKQ